MQGSRPTRTDLSRIEGSAPPTKLDETAASLERLLQAERDHRNVERFFWIFGVSILADVIFFHELGIASAIPVYLLQIIFLFGLAGWMGVEQVAVLLDRLFHRYLPGANDPHSDAG